MVFGRGEKRRHTDLGFISRPANPQFDTGREGYRQCKTLTGNYLVRSRKTEAHIGTFIALRTGVVFSIIRLFPGPKHKAEVIELLHSVRDLSRPSPGCVGCWLSEEDFLHNHVRYSEQWESEKTLHDHIRSDLYRRVLAAMELSRQEPEVRFYYCSATKGLELIEGVRRESKLREPAADSD